MKEDFDREAERVASELQTGPRLAIIGSTSFWHAESEATCILLGSSLAGLDDLVLLTGGVEGVGEAVGRSFHAATKSDCGRGRVFHVLPRGYRAWDYGETLFAGSDMAERREVLGRLAEVYVMVEGGPGTAHEASAALARSALVIPVARSGGHSGDLFPRIRRPPFADDLTWQLLATSDSPEQAAHAVTDLVRTYLRESKR